MARICLNLWKNTGLLVTKVRLAARIVAFVMRKNGANALCELHGKVLDLLPRIYQKRAQSATAAR